MSKFGDAAVSATKEVTQHSIPPAEAWQRAMGRAGAAPSSIDKGCPHHAFVGLCGAGVIVGIPAGDYGTPSTNLNAEYALRALNILRKSPANSKWKPRELWALLELGSKAHNSQMDVVLALWNNRLLKSGA